MKIALVQINPTVGDIRSNIQKMRAYVELAKEKGCDLVVFPELCITGYPPKDLLERDDFCQAAIAAMYSFISDITGIGILCGNIELNSVPFGKKLYNTAYLFENGVLLHTVQKEFLSAHPFFNEYRFFEPGRKNKPFTYKNHRIGISVGEIIQPTDTSVSDPIDRFIHQGATLLIHISAVPFLAGESIHPYTPFSNAAQHYQRPFFHVNSVGGNDSVLFAGASAAYAPSGQLFAQAKRFEEDLIVANLSTHTGDLWDVNTDPYAQILSALVMGVRDYLQKANFTQALVGLSGGVDSALVLYIATQAIGSEHVKAIFMPSRYTSPDNFDDTKRLARTLGVSYEVIEIDSLFTDLVSHIASDFNSEKPAIVHQNLQARIRGILLMSISNQENSILLSTGNKSEMAVGYCTLYGDMCGGLSVLADVWKTDVWKLCNYINRTSEIIPSRIITKPPSAELAPNQTDEDELLSYEMLDVILKGYIEQEESPDDLVAKGFEKEVVQQIIVRICRNEYKRFQAAPGLTISSKPFGCGRQYPLAGRCTIE